MLRWRDLGFQRQSRFLIVSRSSRSHTQRTPAAETTELRNSLVTRACPKAGCSSPARDGVLDLLRYAVLPRCGRLQRRKAGARRISVVFDIMAMAITVAQNERQ